MPYLGLGDSCHIYFTAQLDGFVHSPSESYCVDDRYSEMHLVSIIHFLHYVLRISSLFSSPSFPISTLESSPSSSSPTLVAPTAGVFGLSYLFGPFVFFLFGHCCPPLVLFSSLIGFFPPQWSVLPHLCVVPLVRSLPLFSLSLHLLTDSFTLLH